MNIFYLSHDPVECAKFHVDKHCVKMILEHCQLLSTAHRVIDGKECIRYSDSGRKSTYWQLFDGRENVLYKPTHVNHPSALWVRQSKANYDWLVKMTDALIDEYRYRYGKEHACLKLMPHLRITPQNIRQAPFTQPTPAMPEEYIVKGDSIQSYRNYYNGSKQSMFSWKSREVPSWACPK